jgi:hypothetical protein
MKDTMQIDAVFDNFMGAKMVRITVLTINQADLHICEPNGIALILLYSTACI